MSVVYEHDSAVSSVHFSPQSPIHAASYDDTTPVGKQMLPGGRNKKTRARPAYQKLIHTTPASSHLLILTDIYSGEPCTRKPASADFQPAEWN